MMKKLGPTPKPTRTPRLQWLILTATLALSACATVAPRTPEDQVRARATERWNLLVAKDFDKAYNYLVPGYRAAVSTENYRGRFGPAVTWLGAEVVRVNCPEVTKCKAVVRLDAKPVLGRSFGSALSTHIDETWLLEDDQWWFFQDVQDK